VKKFVYFMGSPPAPEPEPTDPEPRMLGIPDAAKTLGIGRTFIRKLIRTGALPAVKIGSRTLIRQVDIDAYVKSLAPIYRDTKGNYLLKD
jgi:excisionase family DNA binding protein